MRTTKRSKTIPIITIIVGLVLMGIAAYFGLFSGDSAPEPTATLPLTVQDVPRISPQEAKDALDAGTAVFIDVRDVDSYTDGHIPGALSIPIDELDTRLGEIPRDTLLIPY